MDKPGTMIADRYELTELAGSGGMATVWRARQRGAAAFETTVAVKRMLPALAEDPALVTMFVEEAKIAALLSHPNVTRVFDLGVDRSGFYLVMEWVEGMDLGHAVMVSGASGMTQYRVGDTGVYQVHGFAAENTDAGRAAFDQIQSFLDSAWAGAPVITVPAGCPAMTCDFPATP